MAIKEVISDLNDALSREVSSALRTILQTATLVGFEDAAVRQIYSQRIQLQMKLAQDLAHLIVDLWGVPVVRTAQSFAADTAHTADDCSLEEMLEQDIAAERLAVADYLRLAEAAKAESLIHAQAILTRFAEEKVVLANSLQQHLTGPAPATPGAPSLVAIYPPLHRENAASHRSHFQRSGL